MIAKIQRLFVQILLLKIEIYKRCISPYLGHHCRFEPTCSCYAKEQLKTQPLVKALLRSTWRLFCCWPPGDYLIKFEHWIKKKLVS